MQAEGSPGRRSHDGTGGVRPARGLLPAARPEAGGSTKERGKHIPCGRLLRFPNISLYGNSAKSKRKREK